MASNTDYRTQARNLFDMVKRHNNAEGYEGFVLTEDDVVAAIAQALEQAHEAGVRAERERLEASWPSEEAIEADVESGRKYADGFFNTAAEATAYIMGFAGGMNRIRALRARVLGGGGT